MKHLKMTRMRRLLTEGAAEFHFSAETTVADGAPTGASAYAPVQRVASRAATAAPPLRFDARLVAGHQLPGSLLHRLRRTSTKPTPLYRSRDDV